MNQWKKMSVRLMLAMLICLVVAAGYGGEPVKAAPKLNKKNATITVGKTVKLKVKGTRKKVKWSSSNKSVATVTKNGLVKGKKAGSTTIKAKVAKKTLKCKVKVKAKKKTGGTAPQPVTVAPTGLQITGAYTTIAPGSSMQLSLTYAPANARQEAVNWYTSSRYTATVSESGLVTAQREGDVRITAELKSNDDIRATFDLHIKELTATGGAESADGGDLLLSDEGARAVFEYEISYTSPNVQTQVVDGIGTVICTWPMGTVGANTPVSVSWDLKDAYGNKVSPGSYRFQIVAAGAKITGNYFTVYARSEFGAGNGSAANPYQISNAEQLKKIVSHNKCYFIQTANFDFEYNDISPLYTNDVPFEGNYNGNGYSISNIIHNGSEDYSAIFRAIGVNGVVKNLTINNSVFSGNEYVAVIAGCNDGLIENCTLEGCSITSKSVYAGGLCGYNKGKVLSSDLSGNTILSQGASWWRSNYNGSHSYDSFSGGVCGWNEGVINNCNSKRDHISALENCVGGIAGYSKGNIIGCTIEEDTLSGDSNIGGIAGNNYGIVSGCLVNDESNLFKASYCGLGGIIGWNKGTLVNNTYYGNLAQTGRNHWD